MLTAMYYPHTMVQAPALLKTALLLWDSVECIVPNRNFRLSFSFAQRSYNVAAELILRPHIPTREEKRLAHQSLADYLARVPRTFLQENIGDSPRIRQYLVYPDKFLHQTWSQLTELGLANWERRQLDYGVPPVVGLLMMSMLAGACAGRQKLPITDRTSAYSWLQERQAQVLGGEYVTGLDASTVGSNLQRLLTISVELLGARQIPVRKLVAMRKREISGSSADYRQLRKRYRGFLQKYITRLTREVKTQSDVREIERQFRADVRSDLLTLKKELGLQSIKTLFSKEVAISVVAMAGALIEPIAGLTTVATVLKGVGVAPLIKKGVEYRAARRKALRDHDIAWLYLAQSGRLTMR